MLYLVEAHPSIEKGNAVDVGEGPGPVVAKIVERFRLQAIYGNPSRRQVFMVVDLDTPAKMAELMYVLAWFVDTEPPSLRSCRRRCTLWSQSLWRSDRKREEDYTAA